MSKEMTLIVLGLLIMALRTVLGFPGTWQTAFLIFAGGAVAIIGFLLRGEALKRGVSRPHEHNPFVESEHPHEHREGITSLN